MAWTRGVGERRGMGWIPELVTKSWLTRTIMMGLRRWREVGNHAARAWSGVGGWSRVHGRLVTGRVRRKGMVWRRGQTVACGQPIAGRVRRKGMAWTRGGTGHMDSLSRAGSAARAWPGRGGWESAGAWGKQPRPKDGALNRPPRRAGPERSGLFHRVPVPAQASVGAASMRRSAPVVLRPKPDATRPIAARRRLPRWGWHARGASEGRDRGKAQPVPPSHAGLA
jgi:hypothetical protein